MPKNFESYTVDYTLQEQALIQFARLTDLYQGVPIVGYNYLQLIAKLSRTCETLESLLAADREQITALEARGACTCGPNEGCTDCPPKE